jgi:hypothetical protein
MLHFGSHDDSQRMRRRALRCAGLALLMVGIISVGNGLAHADGGKLQLSEQVGPWKVSLFTSPTPPTVGLVDITVLVQQADTNELVSDATIRIVAREGSSGFTLQKTATREAATNKLFQAAWLDLPTPGLWAVTAQISQGETLVETTFDLFVSPPPPTWSDLTFWILWPCVPIGLYAGAQIRSDRRGTRLH